MRILIVRNNYNPKALESALLLEVYLASQGVECTAFDTDDLRASSEFFQRQVENIDDFDLAVVLGGDGTPGRCQPLHIFLGIILSIHVLVYMVD